MSKKVVFIFVSLLSISAIARPSLTLQCNVTNKLAFHSKVPRLIELTDGNTVDVDCQKFPNCLNSSYRIQFSYSWNETHGLVSVQITDIKSKKDISTQYKLKLDQNAEQKESFSIGYGDQIDEKTDWDDYDLKGRSLSIDCEVTN